MSPTAPTCGVLLDDISVEWGFTSDDISLVALPLFHMGGLAWALGRSRARSAMRCGARL